MVRKLTPNLVVDEIEASLPFWVEGLGFAVTMSVPHGDRHGFIILERDGVELMIQSRDRVADDSPAVAADTFRSWIHVQVEDLDAIRDGIRGAPVVVPERDSVDGAREIGVRDPAGNVVIFAQRLEKTDEPAPPASEPAPDTTPEPEVDAEPEPEAAEPEPEAAPPERHDSPPIVERVVPETVPLGGEVQVTILGSWLVDADSVTVGGAICEVRERHHDRLVVLVPSAQAEGPVDVAVACGDDKQVIAAGALTYRRAPEVFELVPAQVAPAGNVSVSIRGQHFSPGCRVTLFDRAPEVEFVSDRELRFTAPPREALGTGPVRVHSPEGLVGELQEAFTYRTAEPPRVRDVTPDRAWLTGGARLTLSGEAFAEGCSVQFGEMPAAVREHAPSRLGVDVPPAPREGPVSIVVVNPDGQRSEPFDGFVYDRAAAPPKLIRIDPPEGLTSGGQQVRLVGDNFVEGLVVRMGEVSAVVRSVATKIMMVETPPCSTPGPVTVEISDRRGLAIRVDSLFTYVARSAPTVSSVSPVKGFAGTKVLIEGEHLGPGCSVRFGDETCRSVVPRGNVALEVTVPATRRSGVVDVLVHGPGGASVNVKNGFCYETLPAPGIDSVAPNAGSPAGGTEMSIEGKNFVRGTTVLVGGKEATRIKLVDGGTLEVRTPPGEAMQMVDVVVRNPDGQKAERKRAFQYDPRYG